VSGAWRSGEDVFRVTLATIRVDVFVVFLVVGRAVVVLAVDSVSAAMASLPLLLSVAASSWPKKTAS
jgi:hypothetical protein